MPVILVYERHSMKFRDFDTQRAILVMSLWPYFARLAHHYHIKWKRSFSAPGRFQHAAADISRISSE